MLFDYDDGNEQSILNYAKRLVGKSFNDVLFDYKRYMNSINEEDSLVVEDSDTALNLPTEHAAKGEVGVLIEKYHFGYEPNNVQEPDFPKVGIELKQTCVDRKKNGNLTAGERLSITNISYKDPVEPDFSKSHVWSKIHRILLIHYLRDKNIDRLDNRILFANLFTPPEEDLEIIKQDYNYIINKIQSGKAHEISEGDTLYLGACTKGSTALKSLQPQYYGDHTPAKKRNFCFKRKYMDYVLHNYILKDSVPYDSIVNNNSILKTINFQNYIINKINSFIGMTDEQLCKYFCIEYNKKNKSLHSNLAFRILGVKSNQAAEFAKANIVVKAIRIEENNRIRESISLPEFKINTLIHEKWEESELYNYFVETKFLFVLYRKNHDGYKLYGSQFWNMPEIDFKHLHECWSRTRECILNGVKFIIKEQKGGKKIVCNNLPNKTENPVAHVRPHTALRAYKLNNGFEEGDITKHADELPNGEWITKQCFFINNSYILQQLNLEK